MINWMRYWFLYFGVSILVIGAGVFGLLKWGLKLGVDFKGGVLAEYKMGDVSLEEVKSKLESQLGVEVFSISRVKDSGSYLFRLSSFDLTKKDDLKKVLKEATAKEVVELRFESVGPSIGPELIKKTVYAVLLSAFFYSLFMVAQS